MPVEMIVRPSNFSSERRGIGAFAEVTGEKSGEEAVVDGDELWLETAGAFSRCGGMGALETFVSDKRQEKFRG